MAANQGRELIIAMCGHCGAKAAPTTEGTCPSCRKQFVKATPEEEAEFMNTKNVAKQSETVSESRGSGMLPLLAGALLIFILYAIGNSFEGGIRGAFEGKKAWLILIFIILPIAGLARYLLGKGTDTLFQDKK